MRKYQLIRTEDILQNNWTYLQNYQDNEVKVRRETQTEIKRHDIF